MLLHTARDVWLVVFGASIGCLMALLTTSSPGEFSCPGTNRVQCASHSGLPGIRSRDHLGDLAQGLSFKTGAELGVQAGKFAENTLRRWPSCERYYLVDIWGQQKNYKDVANVDDKRQQELFESTQQRLAPWKDKTVYLRMFTSEAGENIPDDSLDYIYIDARHDYCGVMEDLETYWPKLKPGGVLAGHDYKDNNDPALKATRQDWGLCMNGTRNEGAVKGAVDDFAARHSLIISVTYQDGDWPSWLTRKP